MNFSASETSDFILTRMRGASSKVLSTAAWVVALATVLVGCVQPGRETSKLAELKLARTFVLTGVRETRTGVGVPGRIDHLAYDPATQRLFVAALENGSLEVLDLEAGRRIQSIGGLSKPQGAAVVPTQGCVAVACGGDGRMHVYDTRSLKEIRTIEVGPDADNVRYDARTDTVWVSYGNTNGGAIASFEPRTWTRQREIRFASRPESFQLDPAGERLVANLPKGVRAVTDGAVAIANRDEARVEKLIPLPERARNFPMAFDAAQERVFIASRRPARLIVIDTRAGKVVGEAPCTDDSDDLFYDAASGQVLVIGGGFRPDLQAAGAASPVSPPDGQGAIDVFAVDQAGRLTRRATIPTVAGARTGWFVPSRRALYVAVPFRGERDAEIREYRIE
jgi:hypothetical protein